MVLNAAKILYKNRKYYVLYPHSYAKADRVEWVLTDSCGRFVCGRESRDIPGDLWVSAEFAVLRNYGRTLDERRAQLAPCALSKLEERGWLKQIKEGDGAIITIHTRVWFPAGLPADFPAGRPRQALNFLAESVAKGEAEIIPVTYAPKRGVVLTACC